MTGASLFIGMPCYRGEMRVETCVGICETIEAASKAGVSVEFRSRCNIAMVDLARNLLVADFLNSNHDHLLMVDDDIGFEWSHVARLLNSNADIVSGVYPMRTFPIGGTCRIPSSPPYAMKRHLSKGGMISCVLLPTGFLLIKRPVIETINEHLRKRGEIQQEFLNKRFHRLFRTYYCPDRKSMVGEDYAFSELARECGFDLYSNFDVVLKHFGIHAYALDNMNFAMSNAMVAAQTPGPAR